eukprot:gene26798-32936_t
MVEMLLGAHESQRQMDTCYRHLMYLLAQYQDPSPVTGQLVEHPPSRWVDILCTPSGWDGTPMIGFQFDAPISAPEFISEYQSRMKLADSYTLPDLPVPKTCDVCGTHCRSECLCGEVFCSRSCMRQVWGRHREICETVHENGQFAAMLTQMEMKGVLTGAEMAAAMGGESSATPRPTSAQAGKRGK